jgi:O-antigen/teichoic acid export membrane protein
MRSRSFATNVGLNLVGLVAPAVAAAVTMPILLRELGTLRLGFLTLAWVAVGAFTLLDFGLGRSLTREVSRKLSAGDHNQVRPLVTAAVAVLGGLGILAASVVALGRDWLLTVLDVQAPMLTEVRWSIVWVAVAVPLLTVSSGARGVLEAYGRFDLANLVRVPLGILTYVGPLMVLPYTTSLPATVGVLAGVRAAGAAVLVLMALRLSSASSSPAPVTWRHVSEVVSTGLWMTVANVAGALLTYIDRFVVGATTSIGALTLYSTPQELVGKLNVVPVALGGVLFPALSSAGERATAEVPQLYFRGLAYTFVLLFPVVAVGAALAPEWLTLWLGPEFGRGSYAAVQWLCLAALLQSLAITPLNLLQALGHAPLTAGLQVLQLPLFVAGLWAATRTAGIEGAAFVWAARMFLDLTLLLTASRWVVPGAAPVVRAWWAPVLITTLGFVAVTFISSWQGRTGVLALGLVLFAVNLPRLLGRDDLAHARRLLAHRLGIGHGLP